MSPGLPKFTRPTITAKIEIRAIPLEEPLYVRLLRLRWHRRHREVVNIGASGDPDEKGAESPTVVKVSWGDYRMWYRGWGGDDIHRVCYATSSEKITWTKQGAVMSPEYTWEGAKISPFTVLLENGTYKMWYEAAEGGAIGYAESSDGVTWTKEANPIFQPDPADWDSAGVGEFHVVPLPRKYVMLYKGFGWKTGWSAFGYAESADGKTGWYRRGRVILPDLIYDKATDLRAIHIVKLPGVYFATYNDISRNESMAITSEDLSYWKRYGVVLEKRPSGWDKQWISTAYMLYDRGVIDCWYEAGGDDALTRIGYAYNDFLVYYETLWSSIPKEMLL